MDETLDELKAVLERNKRSDDIPKMRELHTNQCFECELYFDESALYECSHCGEDICTACIDNHEEDCADEVANSWSDENE